MTELQRTDEWFSSRIGKVTSSRISDVMSKTKTGYSATRKNYMTELLLERLTGQKAESYSNSAMLWGIEKEPVAKSAYESHTFNIITEVGFINAPDVSMSGASPDGLLGTDGCIEIKCPNTSTHLETLLTKEIDRKYILQMHWQMYCADRKYCHFVSFDDRMPVNLQLFIKPVFRDENLIDEIKAEVIKFLRELDELEAEVRAL